MMKKRLMSLLLLLAMLSGCFTMAEEAQMEAAVESVPVEAVQASEETEVKDEAKAEATGELKADAP